MRLHTDLGPFDVGAALIAAKRRGHITDDVEFIVNEHHTSRTHRVSYEIQLGTFDKYSLPDGTKDRNGKTMHVRRFKNFGQTGVSNVYSATYFEWGWFMLEVFKRDPEARFGGLGSSFGYRGVSDFHEKTGFRFAD